eukprot:SAG11_NODE_29706_length_308_cov_0.732057_1_plen_72_part_01
MLTDTLCICKTYDRTYRGRDVAELFTDMSLSSVSTQSTAALTADSTIAPGVNTYVLAGSGYATPRTYTFPGC